jgi:hypothetical protein
VSGAIPKILAIFLILSFSLCAWGREPGVEVRVSDAKGLALQGATVAFFSLQKNIPPIFSFTDKSGRCLANDIAPGIYRLFAAKKGYRTEAREPFRVDKEGPVLVQLRLTPLEEAASRNEEKARWIIRGLNPDILRLDGKEGAVEPAVLQPAELEIHDFSPVRLNVSEKRLSGSVSFESYLNSLFNQVFSNGGESPSLTKTDFRLETTLRNVDCFVSGRVKTPGEPGSGFGAGGRSDDLGYGFMLRPSPEDIVKFRGSLARDRMDGSIASERSGLVDYISQGYAVSWKRNLDSISSLAVEVRYLQSRLGPAPAEGDEYGLAMREEAKRSFFKTDTSYNRSLGDRFSVKGGMVFLASGSDALRRPDRLLVHASEREWMADPGGTLFQEGWAAGFSGAADLKILDVLILTPSVNYYLSGARESEGGAMVPGVDLTYHLGRKATVTTGVSRKYMEREAPLSVAGEDRGRRTSVHAGFEGDIGRDTTLKVGAEFNNGDSVLLAENPEQYRMGGFDVVLLRAGRATESREIALSLERQFQQWLVTSFRSTLGEARGSVEIVPVFDSYLSSPELLQAGNNAYRYGLANVTTFFPKTETDVAVFYRWIEDVTDGTSHPPDGPGDYSRVDMSVAQTLPFLNFTNAKWKFLFSVRNVLGSAGPEYLGAVPAEQSGETSQREFSGGISVTF